MLSVWFCLVLVAISNQIIMRPRVVLAQGIVAQAQGALALTQGALARSAYAKPMRELEFAVAAWFWLDLFCLVLIGFDKRQQLPI